MQPGTTATSTIKAVLHGMDALHILVKERAALTLILVKEAIALELSLNG